MILPEFPFPTHNYARGVRSYQLPTGEVLHRPVRTPPPSSQQRSERDEYRQYAPFSPITIQDAIGDLVSITCFICGGFKLIDSFHFVQRKFDWYVSFPHGWMHFSYSSLGREDPGEPTERKWDRAKAAAEQERVERDIRKVSAAIDRRSFNQYAGFFNRESYSREPANRYQMQVRKGLELDAAVDYHYTNKYSAKVVERCEIILTSSAWLRDLLDLVGS